MRNITGIRKSLSVSMTLINNDNTFKSRIHTLFMNRDKVSKFARSDPPSSDRPTGSPLQYCLSSFPLLSLLCGVFRCFFFLIMTPLKFYYHRYIAYLCIYCMHLYNLYILSKIFCSSLRESIFVPLVPILPLLRTHALKKLKSCCLAVRLITLNNTFFKNSNMLSFTCTITLGETRRVMLYQQP